MVNSLLGSVFWFFHVGSDRVTFCCCWVFPVRSFFYWVSYLGYDECPVGYISLAWFWDCWFGLLLNSLRLAVDD